MTVFVTGATGYLGRHLIPALLARGHQVLALARPASLHRLPAGSQPVPADPLRAETFSPLLPPGATLVHLVGVAHPSPAKAPLFLSVDLASTRASLEAASASRAAAFVYVSVAHPAPLMRAYIDARRQGESLVRASGLNATILRPWYVLGPGHRWPFLLLPAYWLAERLPSTRQSALRLGLVTLDQMVAALVEAVERPAPALRIWDVPRIRAATQP